MIFKSAPEGHEQEACKGFLCPVHTPEKYKEFCNARADQMALQMGNAVQASGLPLEYQKRSIGNLLQAAAFTWKCEISDLAKIALDMRQELIDEYSAITAKIKEVGITEFAKQAIEYMTNGENPEIRKRRLFETQRLATQLEMIKQPEAAYELRNQLEQYEAKMLAELSEVKPLKVGKNVN